MADAKPTRFIMMPAVRDAVAKLFQRSGRASLDRDADGRWWAGLPTRKGSFAHHGGATALAAIEAALAAPETAPADLEEAAR